GAVPPALADRPNLGGALEAGALAGCVDRPVEGAGRLVGRPGLGLDVERLADLRAERGAPQHQPVGGQTGAAGQRGVRISPSQSGASRPPTWGVRSMTSWGRTRSRGRKFWVMLPDPA